MPHANVDGDLELSPRSLMYIVLTTSPVASHPSTALVEAVLRSFAHVPALFDCRLIIVADGYRVGGKAKHKSGVVTEDGAQRYRQYVARLRQLARCGALGRGDGDPGGAARTGEGGAGEGTRGFAPADVHIEALERRVGFGMAVRLALQLCPPGWGWGQCW